MNLATGLLALVLMGSDGPGGPVEKGLRYDVRILEMPGVAWRGTLHEALEPISHQGRVCAWTMPREFSRKLTETASNEISTPRLTGLENTSASLRVGQSTPFVSHLTRFADGPVGHAHAIALKPTVERAENALKIQVQGRRLDQGVLAQVEIVDTRIDRMLSYTYEEKIDGDNGPLTLRGKAEVPEVSSSTAQGEWLIPSDGVLVVSLGLHTKVDKDGKAETLERLALVDVAVADRTPVAHRILPEGLPPLPIAASTLLDQNGPGQPVKVDRVAIKPIEPILPAAALPPPPPPSRGLPTAINHKGEVVETEVPDDEPMTDPDESAEPRATPQSRVKPNPEPAPSSTDRAAFRSNGPNHTEPFLNRFDREILSAPTRTRTKSSIRIEPRIHFEIHLNVPELSVSSLPNPGQVLAHLGDFSAIAPLMGKAANAYLASDEANAGAFRVLDVEFPLGKSVKTRVSVLVESEEAPAVKKDAAATPVHFEPVKPTCPTSGESKATPDDAACPACPALKSKDQTSAKPVSKIETREISLREAIRLGLQEIDSLRVIEAGTMSSPTVIAPRDHHTPERSLSEALTRVRVIEQQYWALSGAQAHVRAAEDMVAIVQKALEHVEPSAIRFDAIETAELLDELEMQRVAAQTHWKQAEMGLRNLLGVTEPAPSLVAVSPPNRQKVSPDWQTSVKQMMTWNPEIRAHAPKGVDLARFVPGPTPTLAPIEGYVSRLRQSLLHDLARYFLEIDCNYKLYESASKLRKSAMSRFKEADSRLRTGDIPASQYIKAAERWAHALAQEADFLARYNAAIAAFEAVTGTLLNRDGVKVVDAESARTDNAAIQTSFQSDDVHGTRRLMVTFGSVWRGSLASTNPATVRIPLGPIVAVSYQVEPKKMPQPAK